MNQIVYRPGAWQVVVEEGGVIAVPAEVAPERVGALAEMLQQGEPALTEVIDVLSAGSIASLGSFAVALSTGGGVRFAVRGPVGVRVAGVGVEFSGADVTTWSERFLADAQGFELSLGEEAGGAEYPIRSGIVLAGAVRAGADAAADAPPAGPGASEDAPEHALAALALEDGGAAESPSDDAVGEDATPEDSTPADPAPDESAPAEPALDESAPADSTEDAPAPAEPAAEEAEDAVTGPSDEDDAPGSDQVQHTLIPDELTYTPDAEETVHVAPRVPGPPPPVPPAPPVPTVAQPLGDHDGETISVAEARRLRAAASADPDAPTAILPTVDEAAPTAMLSAADSPDSSDGGRIRLSTGQVIELDRPVIIGRRPRSTRASGSTMPHLVAVESPQQDISRSHLEIRPEGDSVVVIDLHTTNGSTLMRPGADPVRLHPGEHTLVLDGDTVDLGDGVTVRFEGLA